MPGHNRSTSVSKTDQHSLIRPLRVLLVNRDQDVYQAVARCTADQRMQLIRASNLAEARRRLSEVRVDLALIDADQPDGKGSELADELTRKQAITQSIIIGGRATYENAIWAIRAGAVDLIVKPLDEKKLKARLLEARLRIGTYYEQRRKVKRLRRVCKKLNRVRKDVKQQVDILCRDLVAAYQELAIQMNQVVQCSEFAGLIRDELDVEEVLRRTLEFLLHKAGPTNASIFLPSDSDEFALGGYVNYDCTSEAADFLLQHLADEVVLRVANHDELLHINDNHTMTALVGDHVTFLADNHLIAFTCRHDDEPLAVVLLFRDESEPFEPALVDFCEAIAPLLANCLARLIRVHHRSIIDDEDEEDDRYTSSAA